MKTYPLSLSVLFLALVLFSCTSTPEDEKTLADPPRTEMETPAEPSALSDLKQFKDQYPMDVQLLDQRPLKDRLEALLGSEYGNFRKYWQVETPIVLEEDVLSTTGCETHNCGANQYVLQIDLKSDNINVYHFGMEMRAFLEKGAIRLPAGLRADFDIMKSNLTP